MNHTVIRPLLAFAIGLILALYSYHRITDPEPARQRAIEEAVVMSARDIVLSYVAPGAEIELVDPLSPDRKVGKVFFGRAGNGWELSGHYRRGEDDPWHPYLMKLDGESGLESLAVRDANERLIGMSAQDPKFSAIPP
jgi:hypothetical protein